MKCYVCRERSAKPGVLCAPCAEELYSEGKLVPEQVKLHGAATGAAALIDRWGQYHRLLPSTAIGRSIEPAKLVLLDSTVSRRHAEVTSTSTDAWTVRDLSSTCGTFVNGKRVTEMVELRDGDRVRFGDVEMYFNVTPGPPPAELARYDVPTYRLQTDKSGRLVPAGKITFALQAPVGGGGGLALIDGKPVQLSTAQFELLEMLIARMRADAKKPLETRGFVPIKDLLKLSLDIPDPGEDHIRQLVHRVRRALIKAKVGDLIEVRRGSGYRLRVTPG